MHVSRAAYVSAFEHILYSARGSAITHVASARVRMTLLACAWGEHQYVSDIEVEKERAASTPHTRIPPNMAWRCLYRPPYAFRAAWALCWLCFLCCEKHHSCSLFRDIHSYAFLMQPAILPRSSEARVDNPALQSALYDSLHTLGLGLAWERGLCAVNARTSSFPRSGAARAGLREGPSYSEGARGSDLPQEQSDKKKSRDEMKKK